MNINIATGKFENGYGVVKIDLSLVPQIKICCWLIDSRYAEQLEIAVYQDIPYEAIVETVIPQTKLK